MDDTTWNMASQEEEATEIIFREEQDPDNNLFKGWEWSEWYPIMAPGRLRYKLTNWHDRAEQSPGIRIRRNTLDQLFSGARYEDTVYEMMMVRRTLKVPVYLGQTGEVSERINQYCTNGSHIKDFINRALNCEYIIFVRAKMNREQNNSDTNPSDVEYLALKKYDYAWNTKNNGDKRAVITRNISGNASLRIHRETVDDSALGDSWQWSNWKRFMIPGRAPETLNFATNRTHELQVTSGYTAKDISVFESLYPKDFINSYGIFELMVMKNDIKTVVYVGSSEDKTLHEALFTFCKGESEIEDLLTDAILSGYSVFARIKKSESYISDYDKETAKKRREEEAAKKGRKEEAAKQDGNKEAAKQDRNKEAAKQAGNKEAAKQDGNKEAAKQDGNKEAAKQDGNKEAAKQDKKKEAAKQDGNKEVVKQDGNKEAAKQDGKKEAAKQDGKKEEAKQDVKKEEAKQDVKKEEAKQDVKKEEAKQDGSKEAAKQDINSLLDQYDYAWNMERNAVRNILK